MSATKNSSAASILKNVRILIAESRAEEDGVDEASWEFQRGVLLTRREAISLMRMAGEKI